jgi:hypothetical protein
MSAIVLDLVDPVKNGMGAALRVSYSVLANSQQRKITSGA